MLGVRRLHLIYKCLSSYLIIKVKRRNRCLKGRSRSIGRRNHLYMDRDLVSPKLQIIRVYVRVTECTTRTYRWTRGWDTHCPMKWDWIPESVFGFAYWCSSVDIWTSSRTYNEHLAESWNSSFAPCINTISVYSKQYRHVLLIKKANMVMRRVRFYAGMVHIKWFGEMMTRRTPPLNYSPELYVLKGMVILWKYFLSPAIKGNMCV